MEMIASRLLIGLFTYWVSSDALCLIALRLLRPSDRDGSRQIFLVTRGLGPIVISWLMFRLFVFFPHHAPAYYLAVIFTFFAVAAVAGRTQVPHLAGIYKDIWHALPSCWPRSGWGKVLLLTVVGLVLLVAFISVAFPIVDNDALGFSNEARLIYRDRGFDSYPTFTADPATGYYYASWQIPCLQMLYVWFFLLTGTSQFDFLLRTVAPVFAIYCAAIVFWLLVRRNKDVESGLWGVLVLLATPVFFVHTYLNTQDPHRIYLGLCTLLCLATMLRAPSRRHAVVLGVFVGFTLYAHFFGVVTTAVVALLYVVLSRERLLARGGALLLIAVVAAPLSGLDYFVIGTLREAQIASHEAEIASREAEITSHETKGASMATEHERLLKEFNLAQKARGSQQARAFLLERRGQGGSFDRIVFGRLLPFTGIEWFGVSFWLLAVCLVLWARQPDKTRLETIMAVTIALYTLIVLSGVRHLSWSNPRYAGTAMPLAAYFIATQVARIRRSVGRWSSPVGRQVSGVALLAVLLFPLLAALGFRGAKVGITNPGNLYTQIHSTRWIRAALSSPREALHTLWDQYMGIKQTWRYAWADDHEKLLHCHYYFRAVDYMNRFTPPDAGALVIGRETYYFYYARRRGLSTRDPAFRPFRAIDDPHNACAFLLEHGIDHVLLDSFHDTNPTFVGTQLTTILHSPVLATPVFESGTARVYRLSCDPPESWMAEAVQTNLRVSAATGRSLPDAMASSLHHRDSSAGSLGAGGRLPGAANAGTVEDR